MSRQLASVGCRRTGGTRLAELCEIDMEGVAASVGRARTFVDVTLASWHLDNLRDRAALLTSELVTNAVIHARTRFSVAVLLDSSVTSVTVEVSDGSFEMPRSEGAEIDDDRGRGLALVGRLSSRWGCRPEAEGKTVWFALDI